LEHPFHGNVCVGRSNQSGAVELNTPASRSEFETLPGGPWRSSDHRFKPAGGYVAIVLLAKQTGIYFRRLDLSGWKTAPRKPVLPLVGLAAEKVIRDRYNKHSPLSDRFLSAPCRTPSTDRRHYDKNKGRIVESRGRPFRGWWRQGERTMGGRDPRTCGNGIFREAIGAWIH
ncbi:MAG: hypothetical protein ACQESR_28370, partial [Planctomycetota bacterium]